MKSFIVLFLLTCSVASTVFAQPRTSYVMLNRMNQAPSTFMSQSYFPADGQSTRTIFKFKIGYDQLTFLRNQSSNNGEFISEIELIIDIYDENTPQIPDRAFIERRTWRGTAKTRSYEETQSSDNFIEGFVQFDLTPDRYRYISTINVNGQSRTFYLPGNQPELSGTFSTSNRRSNQRNRDFRQFIQVPDFKADSGTATLTFLKPTESDSLIAINIGSNVSYSKDYSLIIGVPINSSSIILEVLNLGNVPSQAGSNQTDSVQAVIFSENLTSDNMLSGTYGLYLANGDILNELNHTNYNYHLVSVPNSRFPNSWYLVRIKNSESNNDLFSTRVLSRWFDIPSSLLNIDVAIDNLKFIVDENQLRELRRGNASEKERKFRLFWEQRDPTPETEFNELMTEYYRRIDQAYEQFTTPSRPGHESDQGKIFIVYGPADNVERRFPSNGSTQEVWTYADRTFIFTATSGFGDFQLVTQ
jgi:GWxTD domain-containing protein